MKKEILFLCATELESDGLMILDQLVHITGIGKIAATMTTTSLIMKYNPELVINFGSCGGLQDNHKVGDILRVGIVHNDIDTRPFSKYGFTPFSNIGPFVLSDTNIQCFSSDYFYHKTRTDYSDKYKEMVHKCNIIDMELYSIAQVCSNFNIKLESYKWISDDGSSTDWTENVKIGFKNFKNKIMKKYSE